MQCNEDQTVCWCVNDNGEMLPGTKHKTAQDYEHQCGKINIVAEKVCSNWSSSTKVGFFFSICVLSGKSDPKMTVAAPSSLCKSISGNIRYPFVQKCLKNCHFISVKQVTKAVSVMFAIDEDFSMLKGKTDKFLQ